MSPNKASLLPTKLLFEPQNTLGRLKKTSGLEGGAPTELGRGGGQAQGQGEKLIVNDFPIHTFCFNCKHLLLEFPPTPQNSKCLNFTPSFENQLFGYRSLVTGSGCPYLYTIL